MFVDSSHNGENHDCLLFEGHRQLAEKSSIMMADVLIDEPAEGRAPVVLF